MQSIMSIIIVGFFKNGQHDPESTVFITVTRESKLTVSGTNPHRQRIQYPQQTTSEYCLLNTTEMLCSILIYVLITGWSDNHTGVRSFVQVLYCIELLPKKPVVSMQDSAVQPPIVHVGVVFYIYRLVQRFIIRGYLSQKKERNTLCINYV